MAKIFLFDDNLGLKMGIRLQNRQETAEILALQALEWLAGKEDLVNAFLGGSGLSPADLARTGEDAVMMASILDFLLEDESRLLEFCADIGISPAAPLAARAYLPGGDVPHWT
jgi:Protein of unknown function (DUF3572)